MIGLLQQILCWIKQIGAMVLNALIDGLNLLIVALAAAVQELIDAWPIAMPDMPSAPEGLATAMGWIAWSPLPVHAVFTFLLFAVTVWIVWAGVSIILRWAKATD